MADEDFIVKFQVDVSDAATALTSLQNLVGRLKNEFGVSGKEIDSLERSLNKIGGTGTAAVKANTTATERWTKSLEDAKKAGIEAANNGTLAKNQKNIYDDYIRQQKQYESDREAAYRENAARDRMTAQQQKQYAAEYAAAQKKYDSEREAAYKENEQRDKASRAATAARVKQVETALKQADTAAEAASKSIQKVTDYQNATDRTARRDTRRSEMSAWDEEFKALEKATAANDRHTQSLSTTRYALYDASNTVAIFGAAMLGLATATYAAGIAWERDFANVIRTSRVEENGIAALRFQFQELQAVLPLTSSQLAEIGTLAGQLGIDASGLTEFTSVVARFAATTDLSVEQAATAFGRLKALLPDVADGTFSLEQLASSVLMVGTNSVATEGEITKIATQLSSMAGYAGLTADELIGLAGGLASVGTQPELARGTITRLFTQMGKAVADAGPQLELFGKLAGTTGSQFAEAFGKPGFGKYLLTFVESLGKSDDAVTTLRELGITSVRDVPALTRLATAANSAGEAGALLAQTMGDANAGIEEGTELQKQYDVIAGTIAAKLQLLVNNFQNLLVTISGGGGIFGGFLDWLNGVLRGMNQLAQNPATRWLLEVGAIATGLVGVLGLLSAVFLRGAAATIGLIQGLQGLAGASGALNLTKVISDISTMGTVGRATAATLSVLRLGLLGVAAAAAGVITIGIANGLVTGFNAARDAIAGFDNDLDSTVDRLKDYADDTSIFGDSVVKTMFTHKDGFMSLAADIEGITARWNLSSNKVVQDLQAIDDGFSELVNSGNTAQVNKELQAIADSYGVTLDQVLSRMPNTKKALEELAALSGTSASAMLDQEAAAYEAELALQALADTMGLTAEQTKNLSGNVSSGLGGFVQYGDLIQRVQDQTRGFAEKTSREVYGSIDSWQEFYDGSSVNIYAFMDLLGQQITKQEEWAQDLGELAARGATGFVAEIAKMGPEAAPLAAAAVNLTAEELMKLESQARLAAFLASEGFASTFTESIPMLQETYAQGGIAAVQAMINAQIADTPEAVAQVIAEFNLQFSNNPAVIQATDNAARNTVYDFLAWARNQTVSIEIRGRATAPKLLGPGITDNYASGGHVRGPGTGTSDSIAARLSNGEYVIRAAAVRQYGTGLFDQLNRGVAKFANGGSVGNASRSLPPQLSFSPRQVSGGGSGGGDIVIQIDGREIARVVNKENQTSNRKGNG